MSFPTESWKDCENSELMLNALRREHRLNEKLVVELGIAFTQRVLCAFERRYPDATLPRRAMQAVERWMANPTEEAREECRLIGDQVLKYSLSCVAADGGAPAQAAYYLTLAVYSKRPRLSLLCLSVISDLACDAAMANYVPDAIRTERQAQADIIRKFIPEFP
jgi:hypothetical protein